ncbi:MAG: DNA mismatch repair endonuclease MutL [bacterium]|nr:DNA mismatch repair endonuclease MutL [bacterium]
MGRIVQLSKNVINQIAAGEVIERPYSVVKELVENSVDAGATKVSIEIANECRDIRVADNGSGIHPEDIVLAFSKHATSKIQTGEDLYNIRTMGFRGEALASIISIAKLTCTTRTKDFDYGVKVECQNSEVKQTNTGCAVGTIMEIRDLFFNLPARLKFLKSAKTELSYISEFVQSIALIHPDVSFELKFNGKVVIKTTSCSEQAQTVREIFSSETAKNLRPVLKTDKLSELKISGFVSSPDYTRASKKDYYTYVNSRLVKCPVFQKAVDSVYRNLIGNSRYPFVILNIQIPPTDVDVNVHPTKKEVRYKNPNQIFNFIMSAVDSALKSIVETNPNPNITCNSYQESVYKKNFQTNDTIEVEASSSIAEFFTRPTETEKDKEYTLNMPVKKYPIKEFNKPIADKSIQTELIKADQIAQEDVIIGQYRKTYILIEKENGLEIVDQHIAEERYIYEKLKASANIDCQLLFISDIISISPSDKELLSQNKDKLAKYGYEFEFVSDTELIFRKIPQIISKIPPKEILADILENISGYINNIEEKILITTSCKASVKANTQLNLFQMEEIIRNWRTCKNPETCPHGRPIAKYFEHKELAKFFQRNK